MSTEHVVVPVEHCGSHDNGLHDGLPPCLDPKDQAVIWSRGRCHGCLGEGRRALLDQAVPVAFRMIDGKTFAIEDDDVECWVEVER